MGIILTRNESQKGREWRGSWVGAVLARPRAVLANNLANKDVHARNVGSGGGPIVVGNSGALQNTGIPPLWRSPLYPKPPDLTFRA